MIMTSLKKNIAHSLKLWLSSSIAEENPKLVGILLLGLT